MRTSVFARLGGAILAVAFSPAFGQSTAVPEFNPLTEEASEQRRLVNVRIERRLNEADLLRISEAVRSHQKRDYPRTMVSFYLPSMSVQQGAWATVTVSTESKVQVNGLRREDEEVLLAEHRNDHRSLLGSWLTSPPAAPGRLTIYSDQGRIYGEWRLRNGQRTVDELRDDISKSGRRFDVSGGGYYILSRSGDLEIWDKSTLIATAERIRPEHLALPTRVALGAKSQSPTGAVKASAPASIATTVHASAPAVLASPAQPEPTVAATIGASPPSTARIAVPTEVAAPAAGVDVAEAEPVPTVSKTHALASSKATARKSAKAKNHSAGPTHMARNDRKPVQGDQIAAHLGR